MEEGIGKLLKAAADNGTGRRAPGEHVNGAMETVEGSTVRRQVAGNGAGKYSEVEGGTARRQAADTSTGNKSASAGGNSARSEAGSGNSARPGAATGNRKKSGGTLKGLVSGTYIAEKLILNNMRYVVLVAVLGIIFISNRFQAERVEREITKLEQEVRDLRAEALSASAQLGSVSRQSEVIDLVKERGLGLQELREPPYRIVVNE